MLISSLLKPRDSLFLLTGLVLFCIPILASYNSSSQIDVIKQQGELRVVTRQSPTTYYLTDEGPGGFEYELTQLYADYLGVELKLTVAEDIDAIYESLRLNNSHLAAAGLTRTPQRNDRFNFAPSYLKSETLLIYRGGTRRPKNLHDLGEGRLAVVADSSHAELLQEFNIETLDWEAIEDAEVIDLLQQVSDGKLAYTLVDSTEFEANRVYFPRLRAAFSLSAPQPIAWMLKKQNDTSLRHSLGRFFSQDSTKEAVEQLKEEYFGTNQRLGLVDNLTFRAHMESRLPALQPWFEDAAEETGVDWQLLASIGYQESHWNPRAVSPTGVRGIMMLTQKTAREVGVKKRTDPQQSIRGGARYFAQVRDRIPERITEPDRTWFALAAYNVGRGHLEDARVLTERAGKNPDSWADVREHLPLLSRSRWYKTVRHGYARGREPVIYVRNIRRYLSQLTWESRLQAIQEAVEEEAPEIEGPKLENVPSTL